MAMSFDDYELTEWDDIEETARTGNPTSASKAQTKAARKLTFAIAHLRQAVFNHRKTTGQRLEELTKSIDRFNENSGKLARAANWLAGALVALGIAQIIVALINK